MLSSRRCQNCNTPIKVVQCQNCNIDVCMKCTILCFQCKKRYCIWCADDICHLKEKIKYVSVDEQVVNVTNEPPVDSAYQITTYVYYSCCD